jgi:hypothetical protein
MIAGTFVLQSGGRVLARAQKVSAFVRAFDIDLAGRPLELKPASVWKREFGLFENGVQVGRVGPARWFGRRAVIDLPRTSHCRPSWSCSGWCWSCGAGPPAPRRRPARREADALAPCLVAVSVPAAPSA